MSWREVCIGYEIVYVPVEKIVGKDRPRVGMHGNVYTPRRTQAVEKAVRDAFNRQCGGRWQDWQDGPVRIRITSTRQLAKSNPKFWEGRADLSTPDWDNIGKLVCDALNGIAYSDDKYVDYALVRKAKRTAHGTGNSIKIELKYFREVRA